MDDARPADSSDLADVRAIDSQPTPRPFAQPSIAPSDGSELIDDSTAPAWLADDDFRPLAAPQFAVQPPGPGLPEAVAWFVGVLGLQMLGAVVMIAIIFAGYAASLDPAARDELMNSIRDPAFLDGLQSRFQVPLVAGSQLIFLLGAIAAAWLRLGRRTADRLSLSFMPARHCLVLVLMIVPMMVVSSEFYAVANEAWQFIVNQIPELRELDAMNSMEVVPQLASQASPLMLLFMLALVPAIAEELMFRGVIGRGLVARWGMPTGVLLASCLFAMAHIHPAHALSVLPLGIAMHLIYLSTRSFWAPALFHFLNNGTAVLNMMFAANVETEPATNVASSGGQHTSPLLFFTAFACAFALGTLMWQMRVRYILPNGDAWSPGYDTAERPPSALGAVRTCLRPSWTVVAAAVVALLAFAATLASSPMEF